MSTVKSESHIYRNMYANVLLLHLCTCKNYGILQISIKMISYILLWCSVKSLFTWKLSTQKWLMWIPQYLHGSNWEITQLIWHRMIKVYTYLSFSQVSKCMYNTNTLPDQHAMTNAGFKIWSIPLGSNTRKWLLLLWLHFTVFSRICSTWRKQKLEKLQH